MSLGKETCVTVKACHCLIYNFKGHHKDSIQTGHMPWQGLSQDLETGCLKLAIVKYLGVQIFKGDHNILRLQP